MKEKKKIRKKDRVDSHLIERIRRAGCERCAKSGVKKCVRIEWHGRHCTAHHGSAHHQSLKSIH